MIAKKFFGHLGTVTRHRWKVMKNCFRAGLYRQGLTHDLSKFSPAEFIPGVRYYQGTRSPNEQERETVGYSGAWMHHKGRNRHHFEYWNDLDVTTRVYKSVKMPYRYLAEMFCDRVAASMVYKGKDYTDSSALEYFRKGNARNIMHPESAAELEELLVALSERGSDAAFGLIRRNLKKK